MSKPYCINCGMRHAQRAGGDWDCEIDSGTVMELQRKQIAALKAEVERLRGYILAIGEIGSEKTKQANRILAKKIIDGSIENE